MEVLVRLNRLEDRLERRRKISRIPLGRIRDRSNPLECYNHEQFKKRYHMFKDTCLYVVSLISEDICAPLKRGTYLPPIIQLTVVLRFYTTGSFQLAIGDLNTLSQPTVSRLIRRVTEAIAKTRKRFIRYPTFHEAPALWEGFYSIGNFPGVVGAIDGCQIKIKSPGGAEAELFRNRKDYFSINVQAICDYDLNFTNVVARWYGSAHDSRVFENSLISMDIENGKLPGMLLGDSGYPCLPYLMVPLAYPISTAEKRYNRAQLRTRNTIERAFGVWKRRFACLNHLRTKLNTSFAIIISTAILHNISRARLDIFEDDEIDMDNDQSNQVDDSRISWQEKLYN